MGKLELEHEELMFKELPNIIHKILHIRLMPSMYSQELLDNDVEEIKKITNAECESALAYYEKLIRNS